MEFDHGWEALRHPGNATVYFDRPRPDLGRVDPCSYDPAVAWCLAELSRLVYRRAARDRILATVGLRETVFFDRGPVQGMMVESSDPPRRFLVFRGSDGWRDWAANLRAWPSVPESGGLAHPGFRAALEGVWPQLRALLESARSPAIYTGHSLGGALATLAAARIAPAALYTFGSPRVGDPAFVAAMAGVAAFRIVNGADLVTKMPPRRLGDYRHVGREHRIGAPTGGRPRRPFDPPRVLSDHAPVNYVAALERQVSAAAGSPR